MREPDPLSDNFASHGKDAGLSCRFSANLETVDPRRTKQVGVLAALVLASVVLFVFYVLQDYGPESAIRKFHIGVVNDSRDEVQAVSEQSVDSLDVRILVQTVREAYARGATFTVARMDRRPRDVRAAVVYEFPNGAKEPMVWVVEKKGPTWKVDAKRTLTIVRDAMGF